MLFARSTVAAARRESLLAFYGPFASALLLLAVIVSRGSSGIQETHLPPLPEDAGEVLLSLETTSEGTGVTPYVAMDSDLSVQIIRSAYSDVPPLIANVTLPSDALHPQLHSPISPIAIVADAGAQRNESGSISIAEAIQRDLDENALLMRQQIEYLSSNSEGSLTPNANALAKNELKQSDSLDSSQEEIVSWIDKDELEIEEGSSVSWSTLMQSLEESDSLDSSNLSPAVLSSNENESSSRLQRPEGTQRPVLPPTQLVRPIQRAGLLPPPIRPLIP